MQYKTFSKSRRIKDIKRKVERTYKKITENSEGVEKKKLLFEKRRKGMWDFQLNIEVAQQSHEDLLSLDLVKILNVFSEDGRESSLNILLEEVLAAGAIEESAVGDDKIGRVSGS